MLTTAEVQVSSVSADTVYKAIDITEAVKDSSVDNVDETSDSSRLYRNRLYQVSHHQIILSLLHSQLAKEKNHHHRLLQQRRWTAAAAETIAPPMYALMVFCATLI